MPEYSSAREAEAELTTSDGASATVSEDPNFSSSSRNSVAETRLVADRLNGEAFDAVMLGKMDDLLVYSFLAMRRKTRKSRTRSFLPMTIFPPMSTTPGHWKTIVNIEKPIQANRLLTLSERGKALAEALGTSHPNIFPVASLPCLEHLATRYFMLWDHFRSTKRVGLHRSVSTGNIFTYEGMPAGTFVHELCGSMSSDIVSGFSVDASVFPMMQAQEGQLGPACVRLVLGPFRFVQHDCKPNCEVIAMEGTHAYGVRTLRDVMAYEVLTVDRRAAYYTGRDMQTGGEKCCCRSCNSPPEAEIEKITFSARKRKRNSSHSSVVQQTKKLQLMDVEEHIVSEGEVLGHEHVDQAAGDT